MGPYSQSSATCETKGRIQSFIWPRASESSFTNGYFASIRMQSITISVSVCLFVCVSVRSRISKLTCPNFTKFFVPYYVIYGRGSLLFDGNAMLCTSVIVDDVMFYAMERMGQNLRHFVQVAAPETAPTASCYKCMNLHAPPSGSIRNKVSP